MYLILYMYIDDSLINAYFLWRNLVIFTHIFHPLILLIQHFPIHRLSQSIMFSYDIHSDIVFEHLQLWHIHE